MVNSKKKEAEKFIGDTDFVFVDIETTGSNPSRDRVIEVAVMRIRGDKVIERWECLVNPQMRIPEFIADYTGISNEMVEEAPIFEEVVDDLEKLFEGCVFVAHNVSFDYGFLKHAFARCKRSLNMKKMCTVKLSRALYPAFRRHSLDALIDRFNFECKARHRAMGDTEVMWQFWQKIAKDFATEKLVGVIRQQLKSVSLPSKELQESVEQLDDTPGVYLFYGDGDVPLYVGKSINLRSRVMSHFSGDYRSYRSLKMSQQTKRVEVIDKAGDLGAKLVESDLIKEMKPLYNRQLRRNQELCSIKLEKDGEGYDCVLMVKEFELDPSELGQYFGVFRTEKKMKEFLERVAKESGLCLQKLGLEKAEEGGCFAYRMLRRCKGACCGEELNVKHNVRLGEVLYRKKLKSWPFDGRMGVKEFNPLNQIEEIHVFDNWCYLGTVRSDQEMSEIDEVAADFAFNLDVYRILSKHLEKGKAEVLRV